MAKTNRKEGAASPRKPGRSRFSIPRKEAPQIDGSYLDHLFADFQKSSALPEPPILQSVPFTPALSPAQTSAPGHEAPEILLPATVERKKTVNNQKKFTTQKNIPAWANVENEPIIVNHEPFVTENESFTTESAPFFKLAKQFRLAKGEVIALQTMLDMCRERSADTCYIKIPQFSVAIQLSHRHTQRILLRLREGGFIERLSDYSNADNLGILFRLTLPYTY